jgi:diguanylate cyclase (GGDEF)-like protein
VVIEERHAESVDRSKRRPEIMGHRVAEGLQLLARGLGDFFGATKLLRDALPSRDFADGARSQDTFLRLERAERDLGADLAAVLPATEQIERSARRSDLRNSESASSRRQRRPRAASARSCVISPAAGRAPRDRPFKLPQRHPITRRAQPTFRTSAKPTVMTTSSILLVDDDPDSIQILGRILSDVGHLRFATSGEEALRLARSSAPDLILLDAEMPGLSGFEVCEALKADPALADVPIIFVTSHSDATFEVAGFDVGAADFIAKPVSAPLVLARVKTQLRLKHLSDELRRLSTVDALTGVANRRRFDEALEHEWSRARRAGEPLALLMLDVDHFKLFNDRYGHPAGDACLKSLAEAVALIGQRPADLFARYGGEEFVLLLPQTPRDGAVHIAQLILEAVGCLDIQHEASSTAPHVTVSIGIACYDQASPCWIEPRSTEGVRVRCGAGDLVQAADKALYAAKTAGRAQAIMFELRRGDAPALACDPLRTPRQTGSNERA